MAILVTRPIPDNERTATALRARGYDALLSPMLRFEEIPFHDEDDAAYDAVILTSANAIRAILDHPSRTHLFGLPAFAVGEHTADAARAAGFREVASAQGNAQSLVDLVVKRLKKDSTLCYLAGADLAHDLAADLGARGLTVITHTTYRMIPVTGFAARVGDAFRAGGIDAVLHYSRAAHGPISMRRGADGVEISALALPQCCISETVAGLLREAGAMQVAVARTPDENAIFDVLDRTLKASSN